MSKKITLIIRTKNVSKNSALVRHIDLVPGESVTVSAQGNERYQLQETLTGISPKKMFIKRVGNQLYLMLEGSTQPDLIIDGYFNAAQPNEFIGVAEDGREFSYTLNMAENAVPENALIELEGARESNAAQAGVLDTLSDYAWPLGLALAAGGGAGAMGIGGSGSAKTGSKNPATPKQSPVMESASDTGISASDAVTANSTPTLSIPKLSRGYRAQLLVDDKPVEATQTVDAAGRVHVVPLQALSEGAHHIRYMVTNAQGKASAASPALSVVIDTQAPAAPTQALNTLATTDASDTWHEGTTLLRTPELNIGGLLAGTRAILLVDGKTVATTVRGPDENGHYFLRPSTSLADGDHGLAYSYEDLAGNLSAPSPILSITVGNGVQKPTTAAVMEAYSDTGVSHVDHITAQKQPEFNVGKLEAFTQAILVVDGVAVESASKGDVLGNTIIVPLQPFTDGEHLITYRLKSQFYAKTSEDSPALHVVIGPDDQYVLSFDGLSSDTGASASDFITRDNAVVFAGLTNAPADFRIGFTLTDAYGFAHDLGSVPVPSDGTGRWRFDYATAPHRLDPMMATMPDGSYFVDYYLIDEKGVRVAMPSGATPVKEIVVDTSATNNYFSPPTPDPNYLNASIEIRGVTQDTGIDGDSVTADTQPTIDGVVSHFSSMGEAIGSSVRVQILDAQQQLVLETRVTPTDATGTWTVRPPTALPDGHYTLSAAIVDLAGNEVNVTQARELVIDSRSPGKNADGTQGRVARPVVVIPEAQGGVLDSEVIDGVQASVTLPTGTQAGDSVRLQVTAPLGETVDMAWVVSAQAVQSGVEVVTVPLSALGIKGLYSVVASVVDIAGNQSAASDAVGFTLLNNAPSFVLFNAISDDNYLNAKESHQPLLLSGITNAQAGLPLTITTSDGMVFSTQVVEAATHRSANTFSVSIPIEQMARWNEGKIQFTASLTDVFGRTTHDVGALIVDRLAPNAPLAAPYLPEAADGVLSFLERQDGTAVVVTFERTHEVGEKIHVMINGLETQHVLTADEVKNGQATVILSKAMIERVGQGSAEVSAYLSDLAGNSSSRSATTSVMINGTVDTKTTISGAIVAGAVVVGNDLTVAAFRADGTQIGEGARVNDDGRYTITFKEPYVGVVLIRVMDLSDAVPDYRDEATGVNKDLNSDLRAALYVDGGGDYIANVNPLTEMAVRALGLSAGDKGTSSVVLGVLGRDNVLHANAQVANIFGLTGVSLTTSPVQTVINAQGNVNPDANAYGYALAALSGMEKAKAASTGGVLDEFMPMVSGTTLPPALQYDVIAGAGAANLVLHNFATQMHGEGIVAAIDAIRTLAQGGTPSLTLTPADFETLGVRGVNGTNLPVLLHAMTTTPNATTQVQTFNGLLALVAQVIAGQLASTVDAASIANASAQHTLDELNAALATLSTPPSAEQLAALQTKKALADAAVKAAQASAQLASMANEAAIACTYIDAAAISGAKTVIDKAAHLTSDVTIAFNTASEVITSTLNALDSAAKQAANAANAAATNVDSAKAALDEAVSHISTPITDTQIVAIMLKQQALKDAVSAALAQAQIATQAANSAHDAAVATASTVPVSVDTADAAAQNATRAAASGNAAVITDILTDSVANAILTISYCAEHDRAATSLLSSGLYDTAHISGVTLGNLASINSVLDSTVINGAAVNTVQKIQAVVDAYIAVLRLADGVDNGTANPTAANYLALGIANMTTPETVNLLGDVLDVKSVSDINTIDKVNALADDVASVMAGTATRAQLEALGIKFRAFTNRVPGGVLATVNATTPLSAKDTLGELQGIVENTIFNIITHLSSSDLAAVSTDDIAVFNSADVGALTTAAILGLSASQVVAMTPSALAGFTSTQLAALNAATFSALTTAELDALTSDALKGLTAQQIHTLNSTQLQALGTDLANTNSTALHALTSNQLSALTTAQIAALDSADVMALTPSALAGFTSVQLAALNATAFAALTTAELDALSSDALKGLTAQQIHTLNSTQLQALGTDVANINTAVIASLDAMQVAALTTHQISVLDSADVSALVPVAFDALTTADLAVLTPQAVSGITAAQVGTLSTAEIVALGTAMTHLNATAMAALTSDQLAAFTSDQINALDAADWAALTYSALMGLRATQVDLLSSDDIHAIGIDMAALTTAAMASFDGTQMSAFTTAQVAQLDSAHVAAIVPSAFDALGVTNLAHLSSNAIEGITAEQVDTLNALEIQALGRGIANLRTAAMASLESEQLAAMTTDQIAALDTADINAIQYSAFAGLRAAQLAALQTAQFDVLGTDDLAQLSATALLGLTTTQAALLDHNDIVAITSAAFDAFGLDDLTALSADAVSGMSGTQVETLSTADIVALGDDLSNLSAVAMAHLSAQQATVISSVQLDSFTSNAIHALTPQALSHLTAQAMASLDSTQIQGFTANQVAAFGTENYAALGVSGVKAGTEIVLLSDIVAHKTDSAVNSVSELQALADAVALTVAYTGSQTPPNATQLSLLVTGVSASNVSSIQAAIAAVNTIAVANNATSPLAKQSDLQTLVDAYVKILAQTNGSAGNATLGSPPTVADYLAIGATLGLTATDPENLTLLNSVIGNLTTQAVNTVAKINDLVRVVNAIEAQAAGQLATLSVADFALMGITQVTGDNLAAVLSAIEQKNNDGSQTDTLDALQTIVDNIVHAFVVIQQSAKNNTAVEHALNANTNYATAGISGVTSNNQLLINQFLDTAAIDDVSLSTIAKTQAFVDAINRVGGLTDGSNNNELGLSTLDIGALGLSATINTPAKLSLFNAMLDSAASANADTASKIIHFSTIADRIIQSASVALVSPALTTADFASVGITGVVTTNDLTALMEDILNTRDDGAAVDNLSTLQNIVNLSQWKRSSTSVTMPEALSGISADALANGIQSTISLPFEARTGDTLTLHLTAPDTTVQAMSYVLSAQDVALGRVVLTIDKSHVTVDGVYSVTSVLTRAGVNNIASTMTFTLDTIAPSMTPTSIAGAFTGTMGEFNAVELADLSAQPPQPVVISGVTNAENGQRLTVTLDDKNYFSTVSNGTWRVTLPNTDAMALNHGNVYGITIQVADVAGNVGVTSDYSLRINTARPDIPTIANLKSASTTPTLTGTIYKIKPSPTSDLDDSSNYIALAAGDKISIKIGTNTAIVATLGTPSANISYDPTVAGFRYNLSTKAWAFDTATYLAANPGSTFALGDGTFEVKIEVSAGGVTKSDMSQNELHINTIAPTLTLDSVTGDNYINAQERNQAFVLTGTTTAQVGAVVDITFNSVTYHATVRVGSDANNVFSVQVAAADVMAVAANDGIKTIGLSVTNEFGQTSQPTSYTLTVDTVMASSSPSVTIAEALNGISFAEFADGVQTSMNLPSGTLAGDTIVLTATDPIGVVRAYSYTISSSDVTAGSANVILPKTIFYDNGSYSVAAFIRDAAGNKSPVSDTVVLTLDTQAPGKNPDGSYAAIAAPVMTIDQAASEINQAALVNGIQMQVIFPSGSVSGDTLTFDVVSPSGVHRSSIYTIPTAQQAGEGRAAITLPASTVQQDGAYTINAFSTDAAGNSSAVTTVNFSLTAGISTIVGAANTNSATATTPRLADYQNAGVLNVNSSNLAAINSALNSSAVTGDKVDTVLDIQGIVDAYNNILTEANGVQIDADTASNPTPSNYEAIGATIGLAATQADNLALLNSFVGSKSANDLAVMSIAGLNTLARLANAIIAQANGSAVDAAPGAGLSQADYAAIGVTINGSALLLLNDMLREQQAADVSTLEKLVNLARIAQAIETTAAGLAPSPSLTAADLTLAGVQGVTAANLAGILAAIVNKPDNGSGTCALSTLQGLTSDQVAALTTAQVAALTPADIAAFSHDVAGGFSRLQMAAMMADTFNALSPDALAQLTGDAVMGLTPAQVDTLDHQDIQALGVNIAQMSNDALASLDSAQIASLLNTQVAALGSEDYAALGVTGVDTAQEVSLLRAVVATKISSEVNSVAKLQALASAVQAVMDANVTLTQLGSLGVTGVTADNLTGVQAMLATADDTTQLNTLSSLQNLVNVALNALETLRSAAQNNNADGITKATLAQYLTLGISGIEANNLAMVNSALNSADVQSVQVATKEQVQGIVDAYNAILQSANGVLNDDVVNPTQAQYALIGVTGVDNAAKENLLGDVLDTASLNGTPTNAAAVNTVTQVQLLANAVLAVMTGAAGGTMPTLAQLLSIGATGVTADNLTVVQAAIAATLDDGTQVDTLITLQSVVNSTVSAAASALSKVASYADDNGVHTGAHPAPLASDYMAMGLTGIGGGGQPTVTMLNSVLANADITRSNVATIAQMQAIVSAYQAILTKANDVANTVGNNTPDVGLSPSVAQYQTLGVNLGSAPTDAAIDSDTLGLLNDIVGGKQTADVDTVSKIQALATIANAIELTAAGGTPSPALSVADLTLIGLNTTDLTSNNLPTLLQIIASKNNDGTQTSTLAQLQMLIAVFDVTPPSAMLTTDTLLTSANAVVVQSTEAGTAYLVHSSVNVIDRASITSAADNLWNQVTLSAANTPTNLSLAGLAYGTYKLYTADANGNLSVVANNTVDVMQAMPSIQLADMGTSVKGFQIVGEAAGDNSALTVSGLGDVNGDGYADLLVAAHQIGGVGNESRSYVVFGTGAMTTINLSSVAAGTGGFIMTSSWDGSTLGNSASAIGDINQDGLADFMLGAPLANSGAGFTYVVYGRTSTSALDLGASLDPAIGTMGGFLIVGENDNDLSGTSVSSAGDVNGDGVDDLLIAASEYAGGKGRAYVVFGQCASSYIALSDVAQGSGGFVISGTTTRNLGHTVSRAGDVNGDGLADVMVSSVDLSTGQSQSYVIFGKTTTTAVSVDSLANTNGLVIHPESGYGRAGYSLSYAGDVNGDGLADMLISAPTLTVNGTLQAGRAYVVFGRTGSSAIELSSIAVGNGGFVISGQDASSQLGLYVSSAGDFNGDGLSDLVVSSSQNSAGLGRSYVVFGKTSTAVVSLSKLDQGIGGFTLDIPTALKTAVLANRDPQGVTLPPEMALSSGGDINGDGFDDLILGTFADNGRTGRTYVLFGGPQYASSTSVVDFVGSSANDSLNSSATTSNVPETFAAGEGNDTLTGGGGADVMFGGKGNDTFVLSASNITALQHGMNTGGNTTQLAKVSGGEGFDSLQLSEAGTLDLTLISHVDAGSKDMASRIRSIERVDLNTTTANTLTLKASDMNDMAGFNVIHNGVSADDHTWRNVTGTALGDTTLYHQLIVEGSAADSVNLKTGLVGTWHNAGSVTYSGASTNYTVYQNTAAKAQVIVANSVSVTMNVAPVVLDLNGDGVLNYGRVAMDINGDQILDSTPWAGHGDGVLIWDRYADGRVHDNSQYAFAQYGGNTDLAGLAAVFDSNHDGVFDAKDAKFGEFAVWCDANQNGVSDAGEVHSLADWHIERLSLVSDGVARTPAQGVSEAGETTAITSDGLPVIVSDAQFTYIVGSALTQAVVLPSEKPSTAQWRSDCMADEATQLPRADKITLADVLPAVAASTPLILDGQSLEWINAPIAVKPLCCNLLNNSLVDELVNTTL